MKTTTTKKKKKKAEEEDAEFLALKEKRAKTNEEGDGKIGC